MTDDERAAWLKTLKVGDEVALISDQRWRRGSIRADDCRFSKSAKILKVTPINFIVGDVSFPIKFKRLTGESETSVGSIYSWHLLPLTEENRQAELRERLLRTVKGQDWSMVSTSKLHAVAAILAEPATEDADNAR